MCIRDRYYASIWARSTGSAEQEVSFYLKWRDADGQWTRHDAGQQALGQGGVDRWHLLSVVVEVPEEAAHAILLPGAIDQQPDDVVVFDDARVIRLPDDLDAER